MSSVENTADPFILVTQISILKLHFKYTRATLRYTEVNKPVGYIIKRKPPSPLIIFPLTITLEYNKNNWVFGWKDADCTCNNPKRWLQNTGGIEGEQYPHILKMQDRVIIKKESRGN